MSTQILDPMAAAVQDAESAGQYFGRIEVDAQFVVLRKGEKKRVWTEGEDADGRQTEVTFRLNPLDCTGLTYMTERQVLSNSREWSGIVWASLRDLGIKALPEINGKFAKVEMVESGRSWTSKKDGSTVKGTTFKFLKFFNDEAEATAAWENQFGTTTEAHTPQTSSNGTAPQQPATNDAERAAAESFLPHIVKANKDDLNKLAEALANMSPLNKYFDVNSPEVKALLAAES